MTVLAGLLALVAASFAPTSSPPIVAQAAEVEVSDLAADPAEWDGRRVVVSGELVGDYSRRDEGVWVQLNDDPFVREPIAAGGIPAGTNVAIGALIPAGEFSEVEGPPGRYGVSGPIVRLEGTYVHSDPALQGESYLAVSEVTSIRPARPYPTPGPDMWTAVGLALLLAAGLLLYGSRRTPADAGADREGDRH